MNETIANLAPVFGPGTSITAQMVLIVVTLIGVGFTAAWWFVRFGEKLETKIGQKVDQLLKIFLEQSNSIRAIEKDMSQLKVEVSRHYATKEDLAEIRASVNELRNTTERRRSNLTTE